MVSRRCTSWVVRPGAALPTYFGGVKRVFAQIPGGTLDPLSVPKYMTPHADPAGDAHRR